MHTIHVVDAFTDTPFTGNPGAVCLLDGPADEAWMQRVAAEMNLSETGFVEPAEGGVFPLRWFTPEKEVDLCGHVTLASAHTLWETGKAAPDTPIQFQTRSGLLTCIQTDDGRIQMDLPAAPTTPSEPLPGLFEALGIEPTAVHRASNENLLIELESEEAVGAVAPDFAALKSVSKIHGYILTAAGEDDVVCRYFAPAWGINEDPVTGSVQCTLAPYWAPRMGNRFRTRQLSARGGSLEAEVMGERVMVTGAGRTVLRGNLDA